MDMNAKSLKYRIPVTPVVLLLQREDTELTKIQTQLTERDGSI